jgi:signal transduction histidine kinase
MRALGAAMLDMGETLQSRETVLRTYADHVTHELKSPLTVIRGASELLALDGLDAAERDRLLGRVDDAVVRMAALLDAQRDLARAQDVVAVGRCRLSNLLLPEGVTISGDAEVPLPVGVLEAVLGHLISNAFAHGATDVTVTADEKTIRVVDNGIGISQGNRQRIFDPYFTTRRDTGGTGMGLAIVRRLLGTQGARIALLDDPSTVFEITF